MGNCTELLCFLLQNGAAVDFHDQNKRTPLFWAAEYDALESVKISLMNGAKINAEGDMFSTPLSTEAYLIVRRRNDLSDDGSGGKIERIKC